MSSLPIVIVLAAGKGQRYLASGGTTHKLAVSLAGSTVLAHVLSAVEASGLQAHIVKSAAGDGMADSIAAGVSATANAAGWLILPGDLPLIQPESLRRVADALARHTVVVPHYRGQQGHPVGFAKACFDALSLLSGDSGAKSVIQMHRVTDEVCDLSIDDQGLVTDVDTVDDLSRAEELFMRTINQA